MSDEYRLRASPPDALLESLCAELAARGLTVTREAGGASASWPDAAPSVEGYGGHVRLLREVDGVFVVMNAVPRRRQLLEALQRALTSRGFEVALEEP